MHKNLRLPRNRLWRRELLDLGVGRYKMNVGIAAAKWNKLGRCDIWLHFGALVELYKELVAASGVFTGKLGVLCGDFEVQRKLLGEGFDIDQCPRHFQLYPSRMCWHDIEPLGWPLVCRINTVQRRGRSVLRGHGCGEREPEAEWL